MSDPLTSALGYAAGGLRVFPCVGKTPLTQHGCTDASTDVPTIRGWWARWPTAAVGVATGAASGLWVLDSDVKNGMNGEQTLDSLVAAHGDIPDAPTVKTPSGGYHRWFRWPSGVAVKNSVCRIGEGLDVRGDGGYVIAPPSPGYEWSEFEDAAIPDAPRWLVTLVTAREGREASTVALASIVIPNSRRNQTLARLAGNMRRMGFGRDVIEPALQTTNTTRCSPPVSDLEVSRIAQSICRYEPDQVTVALIEGWVQELFPEAGDTAAPSFSMPDPGPFPDHLLRVPGIVGAMCDYMNATAMRRQPVLALAASLTAFGALIGRKVRTEFDARSNLYSIGICESAGGKNDARQAVKELMAAAGADEILGPEELGSDAGVISALTANPAQLFQIDEIGDLLKAIGSQRAAPHLVGVVSTLLKLYTSANSVFKGKAYADADRNPKLIQPHACIYGTTNPDIFWSAINADSISNGLLGRALLFVVNDHRPARQKPAPRVTPPTLVEALRAWQLYGYGSGNLTRTNPDPAVIRKNAEAEEVFAALAALEDREFAALAHSPLRVLWGRTVQKADQLALIAACSRERDGAVIDRDIAQWAADVAVYTTRRMVWECCRYVSQNENEAKVKKVIRLFEAAGSKGMTKSEFTNQTWWLRDKRERDELLATLLEGGVLSSHSEETGTRPKTVLRIARPGGYSESSESSPGGPGGEKPGNLSAAG